MTANMTDSNCICMKALYQQIFYCISLILCELLFRILQMTYEYTMKWKHYNPQNRLRQIFIYTLIKCNQRFYGLLLIATIASLILADMSDWIIIFDLFCKLSCPYIILRLCHMTENNVALSKWIRNGSGIDYATGMASNYFHGYLHLQLPTTGHSTKGEQISNSKINKLPTTADFRPVGLKERIEEYEDVQHVRVPVKKLFILIPQSMHAKPMIESEIMSPATALETVNLDRAGVKRPFKNAVYRITNCGPEKNQNWYVVLESATPMMSFWEALNYSITSTTAMKDMKREITLQFYRALKKMINDCPDTKGLVELVYYNDVTAEGNDVDVGEIVQARINILMKTLMRFR